MHFILVLYLTKHLKNIVIIFKVHLVSPNLLGFFSFQVRVEGCFGLGFFFKPEWGKEKAAFCY